MITNTPTTTIVFVNAQVANYQNLLKQVQPDTEFLLINADQDGIEQITNTLKNRQNITSVQIISHGGEGEIQLGRTRLNRDSIQAYREQLEQWRKALTAEADILLFGCSVGLIPLKVQIISFIGVMQTIARKNTLLETKLLFRLILGKVIKP
jgi:hypothetical protein